MKKIINYVLLLVVALLLCGCGESESEKVLKECANQITVVTEAEDDFNLIHSFDNGVTVTWTSSDSSVIKIGGLKEVDGKQVYVASVTPQTGKKTVKLTALLTSTDGKTTYDVSFTVKVKSVSIEDLLKKYADKISVATTASESFYLPQSVDGKTDHYISWTSSNPDVIKVGNLATIDGVMCFNAKVMLPVNETTVTLTALVENEAGTASCTKTFNVTVPARAVEGKFKSVSWAAEETEKLDGSTNAKSTEKYLITGQVKDIVSEQYCNFNLTDGSKTILVYGLYTSDGVNAYGTGDGKQGIPFKVGDTVYLYAYLKNYGGTLELTSAWLVDENYEPSTTPVEYETKTIAELLAIAAGLNGSSQEVTTQEYLVTGTVSEITKEAYCNFNLTDGTNTILVYGIKNEEGKTYGTQYETMLGIPIKAGDVVKLRTKVQNYNGTYELKDAVLLSVTEGTDVPTPTTKEVTVAGAYAEELNATVKITGVVTTVLAKGFILTDATGSINVYDANAAATVQVNQKVEVTGTRAKFNNLPQISLTECVNKGTETFEITYTPYEYANLPTNFTENTFYANYLTISGEVVKNVNDTNAPYIIMVSGTQNGFKISKYTNATALAELEANVGKYVKLNVVVYDSYNNEWRFAYQEGTLEETSAPTLTNDEIFAYVKNELETLLANKTVRSNLTLPTTGKYDTTITWESDNAAISNTGEFTAPSADADVTLKATVKVGETVIGTVEIKVVAKAPVSGVGSAYAHTFVKGDYTDGVANQTKELSGLNWTLVQEGAKAYIGWDQNSTAKGLQIGSKNSPANSISLSTEEYEGTISKIAFELSGASGIAATFKILVGGQEVGSGTLTTTKTSYSFDCSASGKVELVVSNANKGVYVASIKIN